MVSVIQIVPVIQIAPIQPDPIQPDPIQPDPIQIDPIQTDPIQPDPIQIVPIQIVSMPGLCEGIHPLGNNEDTDRSWLIVSANSFLSGILEEMI